MPARASPFGFTVPYHFLISITGGFAFENQILRFFVYEIKAQKIKHF